MEHRILLVEDDRSLADAICAQMKLWALECTCAADFRAVMAEFARVQPHLVLMDVSLPYMSGYHWCAEIRKVSSVPVIFISSASDNMNIIMAMNMGGDDFVAKPFDTNVLIAKVQALLRRTYEFGAAAPVLEHAGAILNTGDNTLTYADEHIALTKNEYRILLTLMQNKGKIVSREKLMEALWQTDSFVDENTLTVNVGRLRKKLENAGLHDFITTKFGVGYAVGENEAARRLYQKPPRGAAVLCAGGGAARRILRPLPFAAARRGVSVRARAAARSRGARARFPARI